MPRVLIISSSLRKNSNSKALAEKTAEAARAKGHEVTLVDIGSLDIKPCRGCEACQSPKSKGCIVKDDMQPLYPQILEADMLIFASPVYWFNLCGQIKQVIDRCFAIAYAGEQGIAHKGIGAILSYGGDDPFDSGAVNALRSLQDICTFSGAKWLGAVYGAGHEPGLFAKDAALLEKARAFGDSL